MKKNIMDGNAKTIKITNVNFIKAILRALLMKVFMEQIYLYLKMKFTMTIIKPSLDALKEKQDFLDLKKLMVYWDQEFNHNQVLILLI